MLQSVLQKMTSRTKPNPKPRIRWALLKLENLDDRILPSVNATLNGGILKVIADVHHGTSQVEIIESSDQITVEDTGTVVNSFVTDQVQQINFKYREFHHQHTQFDWTIPVDQGQLNLTGVSVGEVDLNLSGGALTAAAAATLPDGTAVSLTGAVDNHGNYDLTGTADISVDGFPLPGANFELTNAGLAVTAAVAVGGNNVGLAGTVDNQGNYVLAATADLTVAGFALPATTVRLDQQGLALAGQLTLPDGVPVNLATTLQAQDPFSLTGLATLPIAGLSFTTGFTLTPTGLTAVAGVNLTDVGPITVAGALVPQGAIHWTGTKSITLGGRALDSLFTLTDTSLTASGSVPLDSIGLVDLAGTVTPQGQLILGGIGHFAPNGFPIDATFILSAGGMTVSTTVTLPGVVPVPFTGVVDSQGRFLVYAGVPFTVGGFTVAGNFTLTNTSLTAWAGLTLPVLGPISLPAGPVDRQGLFNLTTPLGNVTLFGFLVANTTVTLTNTNLGIAGDANVKLDQQTAAVHLAGTAHPDGTFQLTGTAAAGFVGWSSASATFTLTNDGLAIAGDVAVKLDVATVTVHFAGTTQPDGTFSLTGTATATFGAWGTGSGVATFTLTNGGLMIAADIGVKVDQATVTVHVTGTAQPAGAFQLSGTAAASFAGWATASAAFTLTNSGLAVAGDLRVSLDATAVTVHFSGAVQPAGAFQLTGNAAATFGGWGTGSGVATFSLTNSGLMIAADVGVKLDQATVAVHVTGSAQPAGTFRLTGTAAATFAGWGAGTTTTFTLTSGPVVGLMVSNTIPVQLDQTTVNVHYDGVVRPDGSYNLTGTAMATFGGWGTGTGLATFTLNNATGLSIMGNIDVTIDHQPLHITFMGWAKLDRTYLLTGTATEPQFDGWKVYGMATFTLSNTGMSITADIHVNLDNTIYDVHFMGTTAPNGQYVLTGKITDDNPKFKGFVSFDAIFSLNNGGLTALGHIDAAIDVYTAYVYFMGTLTLGANGQVQYHFDGTDQLGDTKFSVFTMPRASFTLDSQTGLTVTGAISVQQGTSAALVHFMGSIQLNRKYSLTGTADAQNRGTFAQWVSLDATYSINNTGPMPNIMMVAGTILAVLKSSPADVTVTITFTGQIDPVGRHYMLMGTARTAPVLDGFLVASAAFKVDDQSGMTFSGQVDFSQYYVSFPVVFFQGWVHTDRQYFLMGQTPPDFRILGFIAAGAQFTLSNSAKTFNVHLPNILNIYDVYFYGTFYSGGFSVTGGRKISFAGFTENDASLTLAKVGSVYSLTADSYVNVFVATVHFTGTIASNGQFSLTGSGAANFGGFGAANIGFTLSNSGVVAYGLVDVKVATISVNVSISISGAFRFDFDGRLSFAGFMASGHLTLTNNGVSVSATLDTGVLGFRMGVSGGINRDGSFHFTAHFGFSFGPVSAGLDLTLTNTGLSAHLTASLDLTTQVGFHFWSIQVGFRGSIDVSFTVNLTGTFSASGQFTMCAYLGIGGCFGISFQLDNNGFCIHTSGLGFSIWGVGFHPFGDYCHPQ